MAFAEQDRVQIRFYLGYAALFTQVDPRLEAAISASQAITNLSQAAAFGYAATAIPDPLAVGGTRPDSSSENQIRLLISKLIQLDASLDFLDNLIGTGAVGEIKVDPGKEDIRLRRKGRMLVGRLAKLLDTEPRADVFSDIVYGESGSGFRAGPAYADSGLGRNTRRAY